MAWGARNLMSTQGERKVHARAAHGGGGLREEDFRCEKHVPLPVPGCYKARRPREGWWTILLREPPSTSGVLRSPSFASGDGVAVRASASGPP